MTSLAVLPVFKSGGRGCFVNLAANDNFDADELLEQLSRVAEEQRPSVTNFHFGYPHLLKRLQGAALAGALEKAASLFPNAIVSVDLNGVSPESHHEGVLGPALPHVDVLHLNEDEADIVGADGGRGQGEQGSADALEALEDLSAARKRAVRRLHSSGVAVVLLSIGAKGSVVSVTSDAARLSRCRGRPRSWAPGSAVRVPAYRVSDGAEVNANGAGDALIGGFIFATAWPGEEPVTAEDAGRFASMVARQRCDAGLRDAPAEKADELMARVRRGDLPETLA
uniref:Carbohydrate kinase PfkB domain-containing protein n=2 Tax=Phaeomonas parva TaxID=124430 RepID=A0A6U4GYP0_9STRA|mmetsp:Transcript_3287/g.9566  ORF Transcript_3287/g.9566 Transcript_3287/m.9566 type:complete len:282 (+) Transcript_3287:156-1001(+)